jgi:hypothetical protein
MLIVISVFYALGRSTRQGQLVEPDDLVVADS